MSRLLSVWLLATSVSLALPLAAQADPVRIGLTFTVQHSFGGDELVGAPIGPGSVFTGVLTYDPAAEDSRGWDPSGGQYDQNGTLSLDIGSRVTTTVTTNVGNNLQCETPCDIFGATGSPAIPGFFPHSLLTFVLAAPGSAWPGKALPRTADEFLAAFGPGSAFSGRFTFGADKIGVDAPFSYTHEIMGTLEANNIATPEPGSMLLIGTGLLGLYRAARRRAAA